MNSSDTWTSRDLSPGSAGPRRGRCCSRGSQLTTSDRPRISLRLEQKTSGLFDEEGASVDKLAGLTKTGLEFGGDMDAVFPSLTAGDSLGGLFQELPLEMTEADYLDSFVDLSNFLSTPEVDRLMEKGDVFVGDTAPDAEMKEAALGFSGIISQLAAEPNNIEVAQVASLSLGNPQICRPADVEVSIVTDTINVVDIPTTCEGTTSDHDYVSKAKRRRLETVALADPSPPASPYSTNGHGKDCKKYRERRDKNNVASRRSRQIRKEKFVSMDVESDHLEVRNAQLRVKIEELEKLAKVMKAQLIQKMTDK